MEPSFQCKIGYINNGESVLMGSGYRADYQVRLEDDTHEMRCFFFTAQHNLAHSHRVILKKGDKWFEVAVMPHPIGHDVVMFEVPSKVFSQLGVSKANIGVVPEHGMPVSVNGLNGMGTTATLKPKRMPGYDGWVEYEGTTMRGYSGSAYYSGRTVYGLHNSGGSYQGGQSAMYLHVLAKIRTDAMIIEESAQRVVKWFNDDKIDEEMDVSYDGEWAIVYHAGQYERILKTDYDVLQEEYNQRQERKFQRQVEDLEEKKLEYERRIATRELESAQPVAPAPPTSVTVSIPVQSQSPAVPSGNLPQPEVAPRAGGESVQSKTLPVDPPPKQTQKSSLPLKKFSRNKPQANWRKLESKANSLASQVEALRTSAARLRSNQSAEQKH